MFFRVLFLLCALTTFSACGLIDAYFIEPPNDTAQELFENASDAMREKEYVQAAEWFTKLKDSYPFSPYTVDAELALGDALYLHEDYLEAASAYKDFEALHPRHEAMPYVLYQIGMSNLKSFVSIDRATTNVQEAVEYFRRLQEMFPDSEYASLADNEILAARTLIAEHELYLADVFWQMHRYGPALNRYIYIVENFPDVEEVRDHAAKKAVEASYHHNIAEADAIREKIHGSWKEWFDWL